MKEVQILLVGFQLGIIDKEFIIQWADKEFINNNNESIIDLMLINTNSNSQICEKLNSLIDLLDYNYIQMYYCGIFKTILNKEESKWVIIRELLIKLYFKCKI